jgi:hypothetical protein
MSSADRAVEKAADTIDTLAVKAADKGGLAEKLAPALEEDAQFLRKLTPSKVRARLRSGSPAPRRRPPRAARSKSALPTLVAAFALGVVVAKLVDWRSYAE